VYEGLNKTNLSKMICHSDIRVWVKKVQILHSCISQVKDTGDVLNTNLKAAAMLLLSRMTSATWAKADFEAAEVKVGRGVEKKSKNIQAYISRCLREFLIKHPNLQSITNAG
jgi:hypothetical protein